jgi:hypothetical protein
LHREETTAAELMKRISAEKLNMEKRNIELERVNKIQEHNIKRLREALTNKSLETQYKSERGIRDGGDSLSASNAI